MPTPGSDDTWPDPARPARPGLSAADCPLEAMRAEHLRQRRFCADMEALAATRVARPALALALLANLCRDLPLHHADEDQSLFPRLRQRAEEADDIDRLLNRLSAEHARAAALRPPLLVALACMADGAMPALEDRAALRAAAQAERRHMTIENAVVLPLAQMRLTRSDSRLMLDEMRARRTGAPPAEGPCRRISPPAEDPAP